MTVQLREMDAATQRTIQLLDLGSGHRAGSLQSAMRRFDVEHAAGVELRKFAVKQAQDAGWPVYHADIRDLDPADFPSVDYVMIDNVLEHLPDLDTVQSVLERSCRLARKLVHIRHPSFEDEDYLASLGLKQNWTDWPGEHTAHIRLHDFARMAADIGIYRYLVLPVYRAFDSSETSILPLSAPPSQHRLRAGERQIYSDSVHGPKPDVRFERPVYYAFDLFLMTGAGIPELEYPRDTETSWARPRVRWTDGVREENRSIGARIKGRRRRSETAKATASPS